MERRRSAVVRALVCCAEGTRSKSSSIWWAETSPLLPSNKRVSDFLQSWGMFRRRRERTWTPPFTSLAHWQEWNPNIHCPYGQLAMRLAFAFTFYAVKLCQFNVLYLNVILIKSSEKVFAGFHIVIYLYYKRIPLQY